MEWRPKRWLATLLSLLLPPLGMLYLQRPRLALGYLLALVLVPFAALGLMVLLDTPAKAMLFVGSALPGVIAAIHAYRISGSAIADRRWYSRWYGLLTAALGYYCAVLLIRSFVFEPFNVPSEAMFPSLPEDSFVIVKKWGYGDYGSRGIQLLRTEPTATIKRGELILFRLPQSPETVYLKRVVGLPGDRIQCAAERIVINGTAVSATPLDARPPYHFVRETLDDVSFNVAHLRERPAPDCDLVVPDGHYFMLGDNRENSRDSRYIGTIPSVHLLGRVELVIRGPERY